MSEKPRSAFMTYVTHRDALDHEHTCLQVCLKSILRDCEDAAAFERNAGLLSHFCALLQKHHETENAILSAVTPEHWQAHVDIHLEIQRRAKEILDRAQSQCTIGRTEVKNLATVLDGHMHTLDQELTDAINGQIQA